MPFIKTDKVNFLYELHGETNPPVVCISGHGSDHTLWDQIVPGLAEKHKVLTFDNQAVGQTIDNGEFFTIWDMARNVKALIDKLGLKQPIVIGWAMGSSIALAFTILFQDNVRQLFLLSATAKWPETVIDYVDYLYELKVTNRWGEFSENLYYGCFGKKFKENCSLETFVNQMKNVKPMQTLEDELRQIKAIKEFDVRNCLEKINVPTLILPPEDEQLINITEAEQLSKGIGDNAKHITLKDVGFVSVMEAPDQIAEILKKNILK